MAKQVGLPMVLALPLLCQAQDKAAGLKAYTLHGRIGINEFSHSLRRCQEKISGYFDDICAVRIDGRNRGGRTK